jgi:hypothetical protein
MIENNLIDSERVREYFRYEKYQNPYLLITQNKEYEVFKISDAKNINFEQYNIFTGFFNSYGVCDIPSVLPVKFSLLFDKRNNQNITSIVQIIHIPYLKINCPQYFITVVIPKRYCDKICYTQKYIENEN